MTLLDLVCRLQLECGPSLKAVCAAIQCSSDASKCHDLYGILINESYEEYRHFRYQMSTLCHLGPDITDGTHCPLCPESDGCLVVAADGLFGLPRKKSSGSSLEAPKHSNRFFCPQDDVDAFTEEKRHSSEQGCISFQAGNALRSKVKNSKLDETVVFGLSCKHEHPRRFLSLKRGESLSNAAYLLKELQEQFGTNKEIVFMYDIACKLKPHLQKFYPDRVTKTTFAVPAFHAYGHDVACQISYSCRNVEGAGLADGEQLERLWSYLRRFGKVTKEMTPSHRVDLLTDALLHYSSRIRKSQAKALVLKAAKVKSVEEEANTEMTEIMKNTGLTQQDIQVWTNQYQTEAKRSVDWTWEEDYVQKQIEHQELQVLRSVTASRTCDVTTRLDKLEKKIKTIEKLHGLGERWILTSESCLHIQSAMEDKKRQNSLQAIYRLALERRFLCGLVRKYADGQKIAIRLSKKISSICQKIKQKVKEFNIATRAVNQPHALDYNDVIQIDNPIWPTLTTREIDNMPVKQQLFVLWNTTRRANEEKAYLVEDCKSAKRFYEKQIMEIDRHSQPEGHSSNRQDRGATAALRSKRREFSRYLSQFASLLTALTTDDCDVNVENSTDLDTDEVEDV
ncbi:uncharacterized protein LOC115596498 isoform X2 [Sparus aurata]|uniref:uncharacterized protein LOC115596498 isoform X2 n=1 Tax=Sparus aurata TaxID=8175 RepID=UPI0011C0DE59|nr:uncharacterized protein LOC115596498 isoform X2 [Sparus aurata]